VKNITLREDEQELYREIVGIKEICMSRVESLFVQHFHDAGIDEWSELNESFEVEFGTMDDRTDDLIFDLITNFKFRGLSYA
jgi:hypothetical protein